MPWYDTFIVFTRALQRRLDRAGPDESGVEQGTAEAHGAGDDDAGTPGEERRGPR